MYCYDDRDDWCDADTGEWVHIDNLPDLDFCGSQVKKILEVVYGKADIDQLEDALEELCSQLDVKFDPKELQIQKNPKLDTSGYGK